MDNVAEKENTGKMVGDREQLLIPFRVEAQGV